MDSALNGLHDCYGSAGMLRLKKTHSQRRLQEGRSSSPRCADSCATSQHHPCQVTLHPILFPCSSCVRSTHCLMKKLTKSILPVSLSGRSEMGLLGNGTHVNEASVTSLSDKRCRENLVPRHNLPGTRQLVQTPSPASAQQRDQRKGKHTFQALLMDASAGITTSGGLWGLRKSASVCSCACVCATKLTNLPLHTKNGQTRQRRRLFRHLIVWFLH